MSLEADLRAFLLADAGVAALVGDRISPAPGPQDQAYPFVTFTLISDQGVQSLSGPSGLDYPVYQIDAWSDSTERGGSQAEAIAVAKAVTAALDGYIGLWPSGSVATLKLDARDLRDPESKAFARSTDFRIWIQEP